MAEQPLPIKKFWIEELPWPQRYLARYHSRFGKTREQIENLLANPPADQQVPLVECRINGKTIWLPI